MDPDQQRREVRRQRQVLAGALALLVAITVVTAVVDLALHERSAAAVGLLLLPVLLAVATAVVLLRLQARRGAAWLPGPDDVARASAPVRRRVVRALRRGELPDEEQDRALTLHTASRTLATRWTRGLMLVMSAGSLLLAVLADGSWLRPLYAVLAVLTLVLAGLQHRTIRGAERVLARA